MSCRIILFVRVAHSSWGSHDLYLQVTNKGEALPKIRKIHYFVNKIIFICSAVKLLQKMITLWFEKSPSCVCTNLDRMKTFIPRPIPNSAKKKTHAQHCTATAAAYHSLLQEPETCDAHSGTLLPIQVNLSSALASLWWCVTNEDCRLADTWIDYISCNHYHHKLLTTNRLNDTSVSLLMVSYQW